MNNVTWNLWCACCLVAVPLLAPWKAHAFTLVDEERRILRASHIAIVTVISEPEKPDDWNQLKIRVERVLKGDWRTEISTWCGAKDGGPRSGLRYLVFASEKTLRSGETRITVYGEDMLPVEDDSVEEVFRDINDTIAREQDGLAAAVKSSLTARTSDRKIGQILGLLFEEETQNECVKKLLELPTAADDELALYVYDTRPIPRAILSKDSPPIAHKSGMATCECIQDVAAFVLGQRTSEWFGSMEEASIAKRRSIADAWFYWIKVRRGV